MGNEGSNGRQKKNPTIVEIATEAGVSPATVSRILNGNQSVTADVRQRVEDVLRNTGFDRSKFFRTDRHTTTIGLVVPDIGNPWFPMLIKGVEQMSRIRDIHVLLSDTENDGSVEESNIASLMERAVDGLIVIPTDRDNPVFQKLSDSPIPVVYLDRRPNTKNVCYVSSDNRGGGYQATRYLLSLGHERIVYIAGSETINTENERFQGYCDALNDAGIHVHDELVVEGNYDREMGAASVAGLLNRHIPFTAVFASDDMMAFGAREAIENSGLRVPQDISLVGFDNTPFASLLSLTTVAQQAFELGKNALMVLEDLMENRIAAPYEVRLPTSLIQRSSCQLRLPDQKHI